MALIPSAYNQVKLDNKEKLREINPRVLKIGMIVCYNPQYNKSPRWCSC